MVLAQLNSHLEENKIELSRITYKNNLKKDLIVILFF
jgi:hypothetical protein